MTLSQKETTLLQDLKSQEQLCIDKYTKYSADACNGQLKSILSQIGQIEQQHLQTLNQIAGGTVPQMGGGSLSQPPSSYVQSGNYSEADRQKDKFICSDLLAGEKHVSSLYDTCIFEFKDTGVRDALNHIQKEEQKHGEQIYNFMSQNGMYS